MNQFPFSVVTGEAMQQMAGECGRWWRNESCVRVR